MKLKSCNLHTEQTIRFLFKTYSLKSHIIFQILGFAANIDLNISYFRINLPMIKLTSISVQVRKGLSEKSFGVSGFIKIVMLQRTFYSVLVSHRNAKGKSAATMTTEPKNMYSLNWIIKKSLHCS